MSHIPHFWAVSHGAEYSGTVGSWDTQIESKIPAGVLKPSTKYLLVARCMFAGSSTTTLTYMRVDCEDDTTIGSKSEIQIEGQGTLNRMPYLFVHSFTTDATPGEVRFQGQMASAGGSYFTGMSLLCIDLDYIGTAGTDYYEDIQAASGDELSDSGWTTLASIAGSNLGTDEHLILGYARVGIGSVSESFILECQTAMDASTVATVSKHREEGEDVTEERLSGFAVRHKASSGTPTPLIRGQETDAAANMTDQGAYMIAIPTSVFADFEYDYTAAQEAITSTPENVADILNYTPTYHGRHVVMSSCVIDPVTTYEQIEGGNAIETSQYLNLGDVSNEMGPQYDGTTDETLCHWIDAPFMSPAEVDWHLRVDSTSSATDVSHRWLIVFNLAADDGHIEHGYIQENNFFSNSSVSDVTMLRAAGGQFEGSGKYLILASSLFYGTDNTYRYQNGITIGSTRNNDSYYTYEQPNTGDAAPYFFMDVLTQAATPEQILFWHRRVPISSSGSCTTWAPALMWIRLDDDLTEDTDWFYTWSGADQAHSTTFTSRGTLQFTPSEAGDDWLILASMQIGIDTTAFSWEGRVLKDDTTDMVKTTREGEDINETHQVLMWFVDEALPASEVTYKLQTRDETGANNDHLSSRFFAINLSKLSRTFEHNATDADFTLTDSFSEIETLGDYTPAVDGTTLLFLRSHRGNGTVINGVLSRLQIEGVSVPNETVEGIETYVADINDTYVVALPYMMQGHDVAIDIDLDAQREFVLSTYRADHRKLLAISMELPLATTPQYIRPDSDIAAGSWDPTPSSPTTLWDKLDETVASDTDYISESV